MAEEVVGPVPLHGVSLETWLIRYDKDGQCVSPKSKAALLQRLSVAKDSPVILFSHGWNNEFQDAATRYAALLKHLEMHFNKYGAPQHAPIFVGVLWPSTWFSSDDGPEVAPHAAADGSSLQSFRDELANGLSVDERRRFHALTDMPRLLGVEARELASLTAKALQGAAASEQEGDELIIADADDVLAGMAALPAQEGADGDDLPPGGIIRDGQNGEVQAAGLPAFLDPRNALRVASVYQMKDRAGTVGFKGVSQLVEGVLTSTSSALHLVGHSYGCKVVLSAAVAANLPRKVETMLLLQPAISYQCFAERVQGRQGPGGYHAVPDKVAGHIALTFSRWDTSLHDLFHLALRRSADLGDARIGSGDDIEAGPPPSKYSALGGYGPRGAGETLVKELPVPGEDVPELKVGRLIGFDGTKGKRVSSHGDVSTTYTAWLLYKQLRS